MEKDRKDIKISQVRKVRIVGKDRIVMKGYKEKFHNDPIKENNFEYQIL